MTSDNLFKIYSPQSYKNASDYKNFFCLEATFFSSIITLAHTYFVQIFINPNHSKDATLIIITFTQYPLKN
jgi:hypothetical protein